MSRLHEADPHDPIYLGLSRVAGIFCDPLLANLPWFPEVYARYFFGRVEPGTKSIGCQNEVQFFEDVAASQQLRELRAMILSVIRTEVRHVTVHEALVPQRPMETAEQKAVWSATRFHCVSDNLQLPGY
jgi:hypothetical protein